MDFDGVICDSLQECLASSWSAYYRLLREPRPRSVPRSLRERFSRLRPFARAAEDFVLIQELIESGKEPRSQAEFDRQRALRRSRLAAYRRSMYAVRGEQLRTDPSAWLGLHRLYPHVLQVLPKWIRRQGFHILSTKRPRFIVRILDHYGLALDPRRIIACLGGSKLGIIARTMGRKDIRTALFIDDQLDHLRPQPAPRGLKDRTVQRALASWGYLRPEWVDGPLPSGIELLRPEQLASRLEAMLED